MPARVKKVCRWVGKKFLVGWVVFLILFSISSWPWFVKSQVLGTKLGQPGSKKSLSVGGWVWCGGVVCLIIVSALGPGLSKAKC